MKTVIPAVCLILAGCSGSTAKQSSGAPPAEDIRIRNYALHEAYSTNEAAAKERFTGRWLLVVGNPGRIASTPGGGYEFTFFNAGANLVLCRFDASQQSALAAIDGPTNTFGEIVVAVMGRVVEVRHGDPRYLGNTQVVLGDCELRPLPPEWVPRKPD